MAAKLDKTPLTLTAVAADHRSCMKEISLSPDQQFLFRPLELSDASALSIFLESLSQKTRDLSTFPSYDIKTAQGMCDAINRYDKLRFVVTFSGKDEEKIVALMEFSFDIPNGDRERYREYGIELTSEMDCRIGPTITDDFQNKGIGSRCLPILIEVAQRFGQKRIILLGGVLSYNHRAIHFYKKNGFRRIGDFRNSEGKVCLDMMLKIDPVEV